MLQGNTAWSSLGMEAAEAAALQPWCAAALDTLSPACVTRQVMDALNMKFPDNTFDLVWACESGEHMPDKKRYIEEMTRVLKPGGHLVIACWCQREETPEKPLSDEDKANLQFLYEEWAHPYFISIQEFCRLMEVGADVPAFLPVA
jgi:SAM-dependent methyltransferase